MTYMTPSLSKLYIFCYSGYSGYHSSCFILAPSPPAAASLSEEYKKEDCTHRAHSSPETKHSSHDCLKLLSEMPSLLNFNPYSSGNRVSYSLHHLLYLHSLGGH